MQPIRDLPAVVATRIRLVFTDIDDTLTHAGKLVPEAYEALWALRAAGIAVIPVTGRPAGWCDAIARQWPVEAVVGENGAFVFYERNGVLKSHFHPAAFADTAPFPSAQTIETIRARLHPVREAILRAIPGSRVAKDQPYRIFDLAIDFREEEPDLGFDTAELIRAEAERHGCIAKVSSIHVNCWFGAYDKLAMARWTALHVFGIADANEVAMFVGDSPNDAPMFAGFPHSVGVANVERFVDRMPSMPTYIASREGGAGFAEIARVLLSARAAC